MNACTFYLKLTSLCIIYTVIKFHIDKYSWCTKNKFSIMILERIKLVVSSLDSLKVLGRELVSNPAIYFFFYKVMGC